MPSIKFSPNSTLTIHRPNSNAIHTLRTQLAKLAITLTISATSHASNLAFDNASSSAYNAGWANGSNGGSDWGAWSLTTQGIDAGFFISSSITNGDATDDGNLGGVAGNGYIDTMQGMTDSGEGSMSRHLFHSACSPVS